MRIDEYLERYERYRNGYHALQKTVKLVGKPGFKNEFVFISLEVLERELSHRERVLRFATAKMQAAIARTGDPNLSNYIICKYFYGMKNTAIANTFNFSERQIYRISSSAKERLYRELLKLMPKPRRGETGKKWYLKEKDISEVYHKIAKKPIPKHADRISLLSANAI